MFAGLLSWSVELSLAWTIVIAVPFGMARCVEPATGSATGGLSTWGSLSYDTAVEAVRATSRPVHRY